MTYHDWLRHAVRLVALGDLGVANSRRCDPYQDLVVPRLIKIEFFDRGGLMWCVGYTSLNAHGRGNGRLLRPRRNDAVRARVGNRLSEVFVLVCEEIPDCAFLCHILAKQLDRRLQIGVREPRDRLLQVGV